MAYKEFTWDINAKPEKAINLSVKTLGFNNGYEQRISYGINNTRELWSASITNQLPVIEEVEQFIKDHKGVHPFYVTINGKKKLYVTDGDPSMTHVGYNVWTISFKLKQVFLP